MFRPRRRDFGKEDHLELYGGIFEDNAGYPTGNLLESFELNGVYGPRETGSIVSADSMRHPILQAGKKYWVGLWTPGEDGYDWLGAMPEYVDSAEQDRVYSSEDQSVWKSVPLDVAFRVTGYPATVVYDFSASQFTLGQHTPFYGIPPNIGSSTFLADFVATPPSYSIDHDYFEPLFSGQFLKSDGFVAQTLRVTFNRPVYAVSVDFWSLTPALTLTTAVGSTTTAMGSGGRTLYFSSATPFTWIEIGSGVFAIDNLTLNVPQEAVAVVGDDVLELLEAGTLTQNQADGLTGKIATVITTLDSGNSLAASNQLEAFINQVSALIRAKKLTPEEGQALIDAAEDILAGIGP